MSSQWDECLNQGELDLGPVLSRSIAEQISTEFLVFVVVAQRVFQPRDYGVAVCIPKIPECEKKKAVSPSALVIT